MTTVSGAKPRPVRFPNIKTFVKGHQNISLFIHTDQSQAFTILNKRDKFRHKLKSAL